MTQHFLESVKSKYGAVAESTLSNNHAGVQAVAEAFGYTAEELTSIPADANMGLCLRQSHSNSTSPKPGEVVVDLGSGGGLDVFLDLEAGWAGGPRHWHRHDYGDDRPGAHANAQGRRVHQCRVLPVHH